MHDQFAQQQHAADISQFDVEKALRNDRQSFNTVRTLSPENYRFRVIDAHGQYINSQSEAGVNNSEILSTFGSDDYTRVYCGELVADYYHAEIEDRLAPLFSFEAPAHYSTNAPCVTNTVCH